MAASSDWATLLHSYFLFWRISYSPTCCDSPPDNFFFPFRIKREEIYVIGRGTSFSSSQLQKTGNSTLKLQTQMKNILQILLAALTFVFNYLSYISIRCVILSQSFGIWRKGIACNFLAVFLILKLI